MTTKSYKIEDDFAKGFIESKCKLIVGMQGQSIDADLIYLQSILGNRAMDSLHVGKGGSHIWIADCWKKRIAIIYYR